MSSGEPSRALSALTLGHSRHPLDKFLALLRQHEVDVLVDVRSHPFSRFSPHFSRKALEGAVTDASRRYLFLGDALGGRPQLRACYDDEGQIDYDRVEAQDFYQRGIERLRDGIARFRVCLLCSEEDPSHCHAGSSSRERSCATASRSATFAEPERSRPLAELRARSATTQLSLLQDHSGPREGTRR